MDLGIFAKTFEKPTLEATLDAVAAHGLGIVQFNLSCVGLPTLPDSIPPELLDRIARVLADRGLKMAAVSGTFNLIHPDASLVDDGLRRLDVLAANCKRLGTSIITLCTGSRDATDMWRWHPDNNSETAWAAIVEGMRRALEIAQRHDVVLAVEPEGGNVVSDSRKARRLLDHFRSDRLRIVIDPANLEADTPENPAGRVLDEAFEQLGPEIVLAHAKERGADGSSGHLAIGSGIVDFPVYLRLLRRFAPKAPLILHGLDESQVEPSVGRLRAMLAEDES